MTTVSEGKLLALDAIAQADVLFDGVPPSAQVNEALGILQRAGDVKELTKTIHPRELLQRMLGWAGDEVVNKKTLTAVGTLLSDDYSRGVAVASYAAGITPLLRNPDRVARVVESCADTHATYRPTIYPATIASKIGWALSGQDPSNDAHLRAREHLLVDLWHRAHERWWVHNYGLGVPPPPAEGNRRKRPRDLQQSDEAWERAWALVGSRAPALRALVNGDEPTDERLAAVRRTKLDEEAASALVHAADRTPWHPELSWYVACLPDIPLAKRPWSPLYTMIDSVSFALATHDPAEAVPTTASGWDDLFSAEMLSEYELPTELFSVVHGRTGIVNGAPVRVRLVTSDHELYRNGKLMGNCTWRLLRESYQSAQAALLRVSHGNQVVNAEISGLDQGLANVRLGQVQGRLRAGEGDQVDPALTSFIRGLVDELRARGRANTAE